MNSQEILKSAINLSNTKKETVIIVDRDDNIIGSSDRMIMRRDILIHRCTSILVTNKEGKFLVQKRSNLKEYCPSYLDLSIGGVVTLGEENIRESAIREINEEIGLSIHSDYEDRDLIDLGKSYFENEITKVWSYNFHLNLNKDDINFKFNDGEVEAIFWVSKNEIENKINDRELITEDSIDIFRNFNNTNNLI